MVTNIPQPRHNPTVKLTRHSKGWVAKIGGKVKWLAPLDKPQLAMERYHQKMSLHLASVHAAPVVVNNNAALGQIGDLFLGAKVAKVDAGELKPRTLADYEKGIQFAVDHFGYDAVVLNIPTAGWQALRAKIAAKFDAHSQARYIGAIRAVSRWATINEYLDRPFRFGTEFGLPSQRLLRQAKRDAGERTYTAAEVKKIRGVLTPIMDAIFLLALNGGIGNTDISNLERGNLDLAQKRIGFARSKTDVDRVIPLWPETIAAIRIAMDARPPASAERFASRIFLTPTGLPMVRDSFGEDGKLTSSTDAIGMEFWKQTSKLKLGRTFYDARRTFQTIGDEIGPPHAVLAIMGHAARGDDMSASYRQSIPYKSLEAIVMHVRKQLNVVKNSVSASARSSAAQASKGQRDGTPNKPARPGAGKAK